MLLITRNDQLEAFCARLKGQDAVAVDTEFMRERTYWPKLCLVQVAGTNEAAAIDPLAEGMDIAPLSALWDAPETVKVFHAGRQDLEIFYHLGGRLPAPVFDTQLAAMVCGFGDQVSYETLAAKLARARLDKGSRFTDWSLRPLSQRQIEYAIADVVHLLPVYRKLKHRLEASGRAEWLAEEFAALTNPHIYTFDPNEAFRRLKYRGGSARFLAVARAVAAWREREAQARDLPRAWVLRDEALLEIAHHMPRTADDLARTRGLARKTVDSPQGAAILEAVRAALDEPEAELPEAEVKRELPRHIGPISDLLKVLLKMKSEEAGVAQRLVASAEDIDNLAALGEEADVPALNGWRRLLFGADALRLRSGELALAVHARKLVLVNQQTGTSNGEYQSG
ncbi:MAG: ribonuclease D [Defluviicoccus sp.]